MTEPKPSLNSPQSGASAGLGVPGVEASAKGLSNPGVDGSGPKTKPRTHRLRRVAIELSFGLVLGVTLAGLFGPRMISFWYEPPSKDAFSCASSVEQALNDFLKLQLGLAAAGAAVLMLASFLLRRAFRRRRERGAS